MWKEQQQFFEQEIMHWNIVGDVTLNYGKFLTAVMNFLIMAFVVFILVKALNTAASKLAVQEDAPEEKKPTKICPMCKSEIAICLLYTSRCV